MRSGTTSRSTAQFNAADSSIVTNDVKSFRAVRYFDMGVSASTRFVGIFQPNMFGIKGIRHQVLPSMSYTYQPDFSKDSYGYYGSYVDASGVRQRYSKFEKEVYGGAPTEERQALSFRIGNVFEMKTAADDTSDRTNKYHAAEPGHLVGVQLRTRQSAVRRGRRRRSARTSDSI